MNWNQDSFREALGGLLQTAEKEGGRISAKVIEEQLPGLDDAQLALVYEFFHTRKISVFDLSEGFSGQTETDPSSERKSEECSKEQSEESEAALTPQEEKFLITYKEELSILPVQSIDVDAPEFASMLIEHLLPEVMKLALSFAGNAVLLQDLIQEGNLSLTIGAAEVDPNAYKENPEEVRLSLLRSAGEAMRMLCAEQEDVHIRDRRLVKRVEEFKEDVEVLKEEFGRKIYIDEAADYMNISEEEVEDILRLSGESAGADEGDSSADVKP